MKKLFCLLLIVVLFAMIVPVSSFAANKVQTLKYNTWYRLKESSDAPIYKITIKSDTLITVQWKNYNENNGFAYGAFYKDKACNNEVDMFCASFLGSDEPAQGKEYFVLYKGTYYLQMYDRSKKVKVKITSKEVDPINKPNYCMAKAINLKAGKTATYAQTRKNNYPRWYKIKLTSPQTIKVYYTYRYIMHLNYELYDSNFNEIRTSRTDYGFQTDGVQAKGTYYLVTKNYISDVLTTGRYCSLYWK